MSIIIKHPSGEQIPLEEFENGDDHILALVNKIKEQDAEIQRLKQTDHNFKEESHNN